MAAQEPPNSSTGNSTFPPAPLRSPKAPSLSPAKKMKCPTSTSPAHHQKGVLITARLSGPLNSPQITSNPLPPSPSAPSCPISSLGKISQKSPATKLCNSPLRSPNCGQGPDIHESTRRALGLDRLRIIAAPGTVEGTKPSPSKPANTSPKASSSTFPKAPKTAPPTPASKWRSRSNLVFQAESDQRKSRVIHSEVDAELLNLKSEL